MVTKTPWLWYTRWDKKFTSQDMNELHAFIDPSKATTTEEKLIWDMMKKSVKHCWEGYHDCLECECDLISFWLRFMTLEKEDIKPFWTYITLDILSHYIGY